MADDAPPFPFAANAVTAQRQATELNGNSDFSPLWSGQNASGCREIPAGEMLRLLAQGV